MQIAAFITSSALVTVRKDNELRSRDCLVHLRRVVLPMREVLNTLMRRDVDWCHTR